MQGNCPKCNHPVGKEQERCFQCRARLQPVVKLQAKKGKKKTKKSTLLINHGSLTGFSILFLLSLFFIGSYLSAVHDKPTQHVNNQVKTAEK